MGDGNTMTYEDVVTGRALQGERFEDIEQFIDRLAISPERKSVLWLLAWSEQPRDQRLDLIVDLGA